MSHELTEVDAVRRRLRADRPGPALPLLILAAVVLGGIALSFVGSDRQGIGSNDLLGLTYWVVATVIAFAVIVLIARRQGHRTGVWVNRRVLVTVGALALALVAFLVLFDSGTASIRNTPLLPGDLTLRGNLPLLAITAGIVVWAAQERRPGLWVVAALLVPLTVLANLYNMENLLYRLGMPVFRHAEEVANLGTVAIVLLIAAAVFALSHRRNSARRAAADTGTGG